MKTVNIKTGSVGALGVLSLLLTASTANAQEPDTGWWDAEEMLVSSQPELQAEPRSAVIALDRRNARVERDGRNRNGRDRDRDRYDDRGRANDRDRDRYDDRGRTNDRDRYRGRQGGILIPSGRIEIRRRRPNVRYARGAYAYRPLWTRANWNVRFRHDAFYRHNRVRPRLRDIVGNQTVRRLRRHRDRIGAHGRLTYRWVSLGRRGEVLQVRAGREPIAEFVNFGRDNRVDVVRLVR